MNVFLKKKNKIKFILTLFLGTFVFMMQDILFIANILLNQKELPLNVRLISFKRAYLFQDERS